MNKRNRLIFGIIITGVIVLSGTIFGLAKTGKIDLKMLADTITQKQNNAPSTLNISIAVPENISPGTTLIIKNTTSGSRYSRLVSDPGNNIFTANFSFSGIEAGEYVGDESQCVRVYPFSVLANTSNSANGEVLSDCGNANNSCNGQICGDNQHCSISQNICVDNCTSSSCPAGQRCSLTTKECESSDNNQSGTYSVYGLVYSSAGGTLGGVQVNADTTTEYSGPNRGRYTVSNLPIASQASQKFVYSKTGYETKTLSLQDLGINRTINNGDNLAASSVTLEPSGDYAFNPNSFSLIGTITDPNNDLIDDVLVKVSCSDSDQQAGIGISCGDFSSSNTHSKSEYETYYPGLNANQKFNYEIRNIERFDTYQTFPRIKVEFSKQGYFWDKNDDGLDNDTENEYISKPNTTYNVGPNQQAYLSWKNVKMIPKQTKVFGRVSVAGTEGSDSYEANLPIKDIPVKIQFGNNTLETKTVEDFSYSYINRSGNFEFSEIVNPTNSGYIHIDLSGSDFVTMNPSEISQQLIYSAEVETIGNITYRYYEFEVILDLNKYDGETLIFFSRTMTTYNNIFLLKGVKVEIEIVGTNYKKSATSRKDLYWPTNTTSNRMTANLAIENIPYSENFEYKISVIPPEGYKAVDVNHLEPSFINADAIAFNEWLGKRALGGDISFQKQDLTQTVHYKDAVTGKPVNIAEESISKNNLVAVFEDQAIEPMRIENDIAIFEIPNDFDQRAMSLDFESENYISAGILIASGSNVVAYLKRKNSEPEENLACQIYSDIKFCTYKAREKIVFTPSRIAILEQYGKILSSILSRTASPNPPYIFLWPPGEETAFRGYTLQEENSIIGISELSLDRDLAESSLRILLHEIGHFVRFNNKNLDFKTIQKAYGCFDSACTESLYPRFGLFSPYASSDDTAEEFWAEFFAYWVMNADQIDGALKDPVLDKDEYESCKNALKLMDRTIRKAFPRLKRYRLTPIVRADGLNNRSVDSDSDVFYDNLIKSFGYEEYASNIEYNVVPGIDLLNLTSEEIYQGFWLEENYNNLNQTEKLQIKLRILTSKAIRSTKNAIGVATSATIESINNQIDNIFRQLGIKITSTKIAGTLVDQSGVALPGYAVTISNKTSQTDQNGIYRIYRTKSGNLPIQIKDVKTDKIYKATPSSISISDNQKINGLRLKVNRPVRKISGKVLSKNNTPFANGKIKVIGPDGENIYTIGSDGRFSFKAKEGNYKFIILNKKNQKRGVYSPGSFVNLNSVKIISDLTGSITLK